MSFVLLQELIKVPSTNKSSIAILFIVSLLFSMYQNGIPYITVRNTIPYH